MSVITSRALQTLAYPQWPKLGKAGLGTKGDISLDEAVLVPIAVPKVNVLEQAALEP